MTVIRLHNAPPVPKDELDRQAVGTAIVIMHGEGRYYEAMDMLCRVVGWPPLVRGFATDEERDAWLAKIRGLHPELNAKTGERKNCPVCGRKYYLSKRVTNRSVFCCPKCGRRFNLLERGKK